MIRTGWEGGVGDLRQEISRIAGRAGVSSGKIQDLQAQAECCKVQFLTYEIDARCHSLALNRGSASITQNGKGLTLVLGIAAAAAIFGGGGNKDRYAALNTGLAGLNGALQGLGKTDWAVRLGKQLVVMPRNNITPGKVWLTWESLRAAFDELEQRAQRGARLGDLDAVIFEVKRSKNLLVYMPVMPSERGID